MSISLEKPSIFSGCWGEERKKEERGGGAGEKVGEKMREKKGSKGVVKFKGQKDGEGKGRKRKKRRRQGKVTGQERRGKQRRE